MDLQRFVCPPRKCAPVYCWDWNSPVDRNGIDRDLSALQAIGTGGVYVRPLPPEFRPGVMNTDMKPEFLSGEYLELLAYAAKCADDLGLEMWLYDEAGWPSGYGNDLVMKGHPEYARTHITGNQPGRLTDPNCRAATQRFLEVVHTPCFESVPSFPLVFTDEPTAGDMPWPSEFDHLFSEEEISALKNPDREDDFALRTRIRYRDLCGKSFRENFLDPIREYCHAHHSGLTGHLNHDHGTIEGTMKHGYGNVLNLLRAFDVPGIDVIWRQIYSGGQAPDSNIFFPRFASSAAAQIGEVRSMSETFAIYSAALTTEEMRYCLNYQLSRGINVFNFMGMPYGRDRMHALAMRPCFTPEMPGFEHLTGINTFTARACAVMREGTRQAKNALYLPVRDILCGGTVAVNAETAFNALGQSLERQGVDFDIADDETADRYENLIVPENRFCDRKPNGTFLPDLQCDCSALRAYFRTLENGEKIAYIYNESRQPVSARMETRFDYALQPETGEIRHAWKQENFLPGEGRVFLISDISYPVNHFPEKSIRISGFTPVPTRQYTVDKTGIHSVLPSPDASFDGVFSGEITYRAHVHLDIHPKGDCILDLGHVECSAKARINGILIGYAFADPMRIRFPASVLPGTDFELEIEVANTAANAIMQANLTDLFPQEDIGGYHQRMVEFESDAPKGGLFGPVCLCFS